MTSRSRSRARRLLAVLALVLTVPTAAAAPPFADAVVIYEPGVDPNPAYLDPLTVLGPPERFTGEDVFPGVVSPFNPPFGVDEILSIGRGGFVIVQFAEPVIDDPDNPFGVDLLVFGNAAFVDQAYPAGIVGGLFSADGGSIDVSADGKTWTAVPGVSPDGLFPTAGYLDAGPYDETPGTVETDFTRPVDPALLLDDFLDLGQTGVLTLYDGAGGGAGIDLAAVGLDAISFVRIVNPEGNDRDIQIDAFADVAPVRPGDANGDGDADFDDLLVVLGGWGACPPPPLPCPGDLDRNRTVEFDDLLLVLANWTP